MTHLELDDSKCPENFHVASITEVLKDFNCQPVVHSGNKVYECDGVTDSYVFGWLKGCSDVDGSEITCSEDINNAYFFQDKNVDQGSIYFDSRTFQRPVICRRND